MDQHDLWFVRPFMITNCSSYHFLRRVCLVCLYILEKIIGPVNPSAFFESGPPITMSDDLDSPTYTALKIEVVFAFDRTRVFIIYVKLFVFSRDPVVDRFGQSPLLIPFCAVERCDGQLTHVLLDLCNPLLQSTLFFCDIIWKISD